MGLFSSLFGSKPTQEPEPEVNEDEAPGVALEELAAALDSPEGALRVDAARALIERWRGGDPHAAEAIAPRLTELLEDPEPLVRIAALSGVRMLRKPENLEKCASGTLALLADPVAQVRVAAVWASLRLPGDAARTQVRALMASTEETMRFAAACALSDARDSAALPELTAALRDDHRRQPRRCRRLPSSSRRNRWASSTGRWSRRRWRGSATRAAARIWSSASSGRATTVPSPPSGPAASACRTRYRR